MTDYYSVTPPPELVQQWINKADGGHDPRWQEYEQDIANWAAQWGADQELLAAGKYLKQCAAWDEEDVIELYNHRRPRPKPQSLKEQALAVLENEPEADDMKELVVFDVDQVEIIRRALEQLDD